MKVYFPCGFALLQEVYVSSLLLSEQESYDSHDLLSENRVIDNINNDDIDEAAPEKCPSILIKE